MWHGESQAVRMSTLNTERKEVKIATAAPTLIQDAGSPILIRGTSTTAVYNKTNSNYEAARYVDEKKLINYASSRSSSSATV